jgi:hypothetical protein
VLQEANSIGTTYLRASLLPDTHKIVVEEMLRRYVDVRLDFYNAGIDTKKIIEAENETAALQREMWAHATAAAEEAPTPITATFIDTLNDTIDLDASSLAALRAKVPSAVWLLVLFVAGIGCCSCGYGAGASGSRSIFSNAMLPLLVAVVITLIADLDRPRQGLVGISQQPLLDLKASLSNAKSK